MAHLAEAGGLPGLADSLSNYNTPYLALLVLLTYLQPAQQAGRLPGSGRNPSGGPGGPRSGYVFTDNAPTPYAWLPADAGEIWKYAGLAFAAAVACASGSGCWPAPFTGPSPILLLAATLVVPVLLPEMHERYFYLAEVLTVLAAFVDRGYAGVPVTL